MPTVEYRGERPYVVTTAGGTKLAGFFSITSAIELAKAGRERVVMSRKANLWVKHSHYKRGVKVPII